MNEKQKTRYTLKPTNTPASPQKKERAKEGLRLSQNEDDDLYDPYTDYHDGTLGAQTFEEDPWK